MTEIATIDWFGRWGTSVFSENTAILVTCVSAFNQTVFFVLPSKQHLINWTSQFPI